MSTLTRETILAARKLPSLTVNVPEWGGDICIKKMTGVERDAFEALCVARRNAPGGMNGKEIKAMLLVAVLTDADSKLLFSQADVPALNQLEGDVIDRLARQAMTYNGMTEDENKKEKDSFTNARSDASGS